MRHSERVVAKAAQVSDVVYAALRARDCVLAGAEPDGSGWLLWLSVLYAASHYGWDLSPTTLYRRSTGQQKPRLYIAEMDEYLEYLGAAI